MKTGGEVMKRFYASGPSGMIEATVSGMLNPRIIAATFSYVLAMMKAVWKVDGGAEDHARI